MSGLNNYLVGLLSGNLVGQLLPCLSCDGIFANLATILPRFTNPTHEQRLLNLKLVSQRQRNRFKLLSIPHYLCLFNQGVKVQRECLISFFMLNCPDSLFNILQPNRLIKIDRYSVVPFLGSNQHFRGRIKVPCHVHKRTGRRNCWSREGLSNSVGQCI